MNISRVKVWHKALSSQEVKKHYHREFTKKGRFLNDLEYRWHRKTWNNDRYWRLKGKWRRLKQKVRRLKKED